jgi:hypothetical protein
MEIRWQNIKGEEHRGKIPANLWPIIDALGLHDGAEFLLYFRGRDFYVGKGAKAFRSAMVELFGPAKTNLLHNALTAAGYGNANGKNYVVPSATVFLSRYLRSKGLNLNEIAHRLGTSTVTVRSCLKSDAEREVRYEKDKMRRINEAISEAVALGLVVRLEQPKKKAAR